MTVENLNADSRGGETADRLGRRSSALAVPVSEIDHVQGPPDAPITLVEYGDYECPYCGRAHPIVKRLRQEFPQQLRLVYRHFPLNTIHEHAGVAAQAAEAAAAQGKFWEMHDLLFEHQDDLAEADLLHYALKVGLEIYRFESDLAREAYTERIRSDFRGGVRSGVNRTPTFFINGSRYDGALEHDALRREIAGKLGAELVDRRD